VTLDWKVSDLVTDYGSCCGLQNRANSKSQTFRLFDIGYRCRNCPSASWSSAANSTSRCTGVRKGFA